MSHILTRDFLNKLYNIDKKSVPVIARELNFSEHKINYWLGRNKILKRSISEAIYLKNNPNGDPFKFKPPKTNGEHKLFGMGIGLYWGEGNKANKNVVKLDNSDPELLKTFIHFLLKFFDIKKDDLRFHLHVFTDIDLKMAKNFWIKNLKIKEKQIYKPTITITGKLGTYRNKSQFGVMTVYYANTKLRNLIIDLIQSNM